MDAITQLRELDLTEYPIDEIRALLRQAGKLGIMLTDFHDNKPIDRVVANSTEEPEFSTVARLSFKPARYNKTFLRASTPRNTMFYGTVISEELKDKEQRYARLVGAAEVSSLMRNKDVFEGYSIITTGRWMVTEDLSLATIIDPSLSYHEPYLEKIKNRYTTFLDQGPVDVKNNTLKWLQFLSSEFSREVANGNNHEYLISSIFTEICVQAKGMDGVIYPSVQTKGYGLCVAIHPKAINKLKLTKVMQSRIVKTIENGSPTYFIDNEKFCEVEDGKDSFQLQPIR